VSPDALVHRARGVPVFESSLFENTGEVNLHRVLGAAENCGSISVSLSLRHPRQHLGLTRREAERFKRFGGIALSNATENTQAHEASNAWVSHNNVIQHLDFW